MSNTETVQVTPALTTRANVADLDKELSDFRDGLLIAKSTPAADFIKFVDEQLKELRGKLVYGFGQ